MGSEWGVSGERVGSWLRMYGVGRVLFTYNVRASLLLKDQIRIALLRTFSKEVKYATRIAGMGVYRIAFSRYLKWRDVYDE